MQSKEINATVIDSTQADEIRKPEKFSLAGIQKRNLTSTRTVQCLFWFQLFFFLKFYYITK